MKNPYATKLAFKQGRPNIKKSELINCIVCMKVVSVSLEDVGVHACTLVLPIPILMVHKYSVTTGLKLLVICQEGYRLRENTHLGMTPQILSQPLTPSIITL